MFCYLPKGKKWKCKALYTQPEAFSLQSYLILLWTPWKPHNFNLFVACSLQPTHTHSGPHRYLYQCLHQHSSPAALQDQWSLAILTSTHHSAHLLPQHSQSHSSNASMCQPACHPLESTLQHPPYATSQEPMGHTQLQKSKPNVLEQSVRTLLLGTCSGAKHSTVPYTSAQVWVSTLHLLS